MTKAQLTQLTALQEQSLALFNEDRFLELIQFLLGQPQVFPDKQVTGLPCDKTPGSFGYRLGLTQWAVKEPNNWDDGSHWVVFTVGLDEATINLHGCISQSVEWVNASIDRQWAYQKKLSRLEADQIVASAVAVAA